MRLSFFSNIRNANVALQLFFLLLLQWLNVPAAISQDAASPVPIVEFKSIEEALLDPEKVVKLNLKREKLREFPDELHQFPNLKYLNLSRNKIKRIPQNLQHLQNLEYLDLSRNEIDTLGEAIGDLHNLRVLKLGNNEIYHIPPEIGKLARLKILELWSNNIYYFPTEAGQLQELRELDLRGIMMNEQQQEDIRSIFNQKIRLRLSPSCNCI